MAKRYAPADYKPIIYAIGGEDARAAVLVAQAMIEHQLERVLKANLRQPESKTEEEVLFSDNGLMGSFSEKIWGAYFMKLIGPKTRLDFDLIRKMRNECAHNMNPVDLTEDPLRAYLHGLRPPAKHDQEFTSRGPRFLFAEIANDLIQGLMLRSANHSDLNEAYTVKHLAE
jgi:hypothetical protein